jgi:hypothetical protein
VVLPIVLIVSGIVACIRCAKAGRAAEASHTVITMPMSNPAYGAPLVYNGAPSYQASAPPPSYQGGSTRDWR